MTDAEDEQVHAQAAEWIGRLGRPHLPLEDRKAFAAWMAAEARHRAAFEALMKTWEQLGVLQHATNAQLAARTAGGQRREPVAARGSILRWWRPAALSAFSALLAVTAYWSHSPLTQVRTVARVMQTERMDDGTIIEANVSTSYGFSFDANQRFIRLDRGEAFFQVAHDRARPFRVSTRDGVITATGTAFSIEQRRDGTRLALTEGSVDIAPGRAVASVVRVQAPALLLFSASGAVAIRGSAEDAVAWRQGQLIYDQVTLAELLEDLSRYMPAHVQLTDPKLAQRKVSAVLRLEDQEATLNALARILGLHWWRVDPDIILLGPNA